MKPNRGKPPDRETRYRNHAELRVEGGEDTGRPKVIVGNAVVYDTPSQDLCGFIEIIKPGAFTESLKTADVRALVDHDPTLILGRNTAGTLRIIDGPDALAVEIDPPNTSYANDLAESIRLGNVDGMSFGFVAIEDDWTEVNGVVTRTVIKAEIYDVSAVSYPAYIETSLALRSLDRWKQAHPAPKLNERDLLKVRLRESYLRPSNVPRPSKAS